MYKKIFSSIAIALVVFFGCRPGVLAQTIAPSFPACANPSGTVRVSYPSGTHGIVGSQNAFSGADTVYDIGNGNHVQCFCADDGSGIQTNWWNVSSLSQEEIDILLTQGWTYIPNGAVWGLEEAPFLVQNNNYSCRGGGGSTNGSSTSSGGGGGSVAGASNSVGSVLGLAATGGVIPMYFFGSLGTVSLALGFLLRRKKSA